MKKFLSVVVTIITASGFFAMAVGEASGQQSGLQKQVIGTWTLMSNAITQPDGSKYLPFGANPQGILIFDTGGRYSLQICRTTDRVKFVSNNREKGTPEENAAAIRGCNPHWGTYVVNDSERTITFNIERGLFPNWEGIQQKRSFVLTGDELKYVVPAASAGGTAEVVWRRAK